MGDSGEGLVDAEARIQERMEELARARSEREGADPRNPEDLRALEGLRLARAEFARQLASTAHERRRAVISQAMDEVDRRIAELTTRLGG